MYTLYIYTYIHLTEQTQAGAHKNRARAGERDHNTPHQPAGQRPAASRRLRLRPPRLRPCARHASGTTAAAHRLHAAATAAAPGGDAVVAPQVLQQLHLTTSCRHSPASGSRGPCSSGEGSGAGSSEPPVSASRCCTNQAGRQDARAGAVLAGLLRSMIARVSCGRVGRLIEIRMCCCT